MKFQGTEDIMVSFDVRSLFIKINNVPMSDLAIESVQVIQVFVQKERSIWFKDIPPIAHNCCY